MFAVKLRFTKDFVLIRNSTFNVPICWSDDLSSQQSKNKKLANLADSRHNSRSSSLLYCFLSFNKRTARANGLKWCSSQDKEATSLKLAAMTFDSMPKNTLHCLMLIL
jgi:hypothetical protein